VILATLGTQVLAAGLSLVAAFIFVLGLAMQQRGNLAAMRAARDGTARRPAALATMLQPSWIIGLTFGGGVGFAIIAVALKVGSLAVVEPIQVTQMIFTVPLSAWVANVAVERREWRAAVVLVAGLAAALIALAPVPGGDVGDPGGWRLVVPIVVVLAIVLTFAAWRAPAYAAALFGAASGCVFGLHGAMAKEVTGLVVEGFSIAALFGSWAFYGVLLATPIGVIIQNLALRSGRLSAAQTTVTTSAPLMSTAIGMAVFGETVQLSPVRVLVAVTGAAVCGWGIAQLAKSPALLAAHELDADPAPATA